MKYISKEDLEYLIPNNIDLELAYYKGLAKDNELNDEYLELYSIYYNYLELYLNNILNIKEKEQYLDNLNKKFNQVDDSEKDIYQYLSNNKYFYLRNTLYVEKLSKEDINYLLQNPNNYNEKIEKIIDNTFAEIITTSLFETPECNLFYGPQTSNYSALNNNLVIGIRFGEENSDLYDNDDVWFQDYSFRRMVINNLLNNMPKRVKFTEIKYIEYFEESVKKNKFDNTPKRIN